MLFPGMKTGAWCEFDQGHRNGLEVAESESESISVQFSNGGPIMSHATAILKTELKLISIPILLLLICSKTESFCRASEAVAGSGFTIH
jgi:hypothetical protein